MQEIKQEYVALITGANSGIGLELTRKLIAKGWQVIALNRSEVGNEDIELQKAIRSKRLRIYKVADLTNYDNLQLTLKKLHDQETYIDVIFNNAGQSFPELTYSKQGRETHYELMTIVPYIILMELKDLLLKGTLKTVINTSSSALNMRKSFSLEELEHPQKLRKVVGPYAASKLALSLWTEAIAPSLAHEGIFIRSVDPGNNNTVRKGQKSGLPFWMKSLMRFTPPPTHGARLLFDSAVGEHHNKSGVFLIKGKVQSLPFRESAPQLLNRVEEIYRQQFKQMT